MVIPTPTQGIWDKVQTKVLAEGGVWGGKKKTGWVDYWPTYREDTYIRYQDGRLTFGSVGGSAVKEILTSAEEFLNETKEKKMAESVSTITEWQLVTALLAADATHRYLFWGPPGTGKTTTAVKARGEGGHYSVTLHEDSTVAEMLGHWVPRGDEFYWHDGPVTKAWMDGDLLVLNEIDHASGPVLTILLAILDDKAVAGLTLPNGKTIHPHKDFKVIATMNGIPEDLPAPLVDRFDGQLEIDRPSDEAITSLPEDLQFLAKNAYSNKTSRNMTFRQIMSFGKLREAFKATMEVNQALESAGKLVFGTNCADILDVIKIGERGAV